VLGAYRSLRRFRRPCGDHLSWAARAVELFHKQLLLTSFARQPTRPEAIQVSQATEFLLMLVLATCLCAAGWLLVGARRAPAGHAVRPPAAPDLPPSPPRVAVPGPEPDRPAAAQAVRQQRQNTSAAGRIARLRAPARGPVRHR
jgi:hypothetical protein